MNKNTTATTERDTIANRNSHNRTLDVFAFLADHDFEPSDRDNGETWADNRSTALRVIIDGENTIRVIKFTDSRLWTCAWAMNFGASVPASVINASIKAAMES